MQDKCQAWQVNDALADTVVGSMHQGSNQPMVRHALGVARQAILRCARARDWAVHKLEAEEAQEVNKGKVETASINSVHLNKNH